jgi:dGTPase
MDNDNKDIEFKDEIKNTIKRLHYSMHMKLEDIYSEIGGADPKLVEELYNELLADHTNHTIPNQENNTYESRRLSANLPLDLPAPDPMRSQWWFSLDTVQKLSERVWELSENKPAAFLGTPTVGYHFTHCFNSEATIFDNDPDVINSLKLPANGNAIIYDAHDPPPDEVKKIHSVVLLDPPWYKEITDLFLSRARSFLNDSGYILCVLPSRLTRPGLISERTDLLNKLLSSHFEVVSLESGFVRYRVPEFEEKVFKSVIGFSGNPWRNGDLLILKVGTNSSYDIASIPEHEKEAIFSRDSHKARFFLRNKENSNFDKWIEPIVEFEENVSTRSIPLESVSLWGTDKRGFKIKDFSVAQKILKSWASGNTQEETESNLINSGINAKQSKEIISMFSTTLLLWEQPSSPFRRRTPKQLFEHRKKYVSDYAATPSSRGQTFTPDEFRLEFQRDRDRVLWSHSLKRLANKTQVFPTDSDDRLRRRLSHCIEVMQLASTIAVSFGLDRDLTEAGALAHDLGHTPFGHAGEHSLNQTLNEIDTNIGGFNHYEHGLDVVSWLEDIYRSPGAEEIYGLNLTPETKECILKHTYHRENEEIGQNTLIRNSKHKDIDSRSCHLEGQAVRAADKISYLISDLEDGIRMGVIEIDDLRSCRFFDRPPIDLSIAQKETLFDRFLSQRRGILKILMEDILTATDDRLRSMKSLDEIRDSEPYTVEHSEIIKIELTEIWDKLQVGRLHKESTVIAANLRAANVIRDLFILFTLQPELVESRFKRSHEGLKTTEYMKWYRNKLGENIGIPKRFFSERSYDHIIGPKLRSQGDNYLIPIWNLILAKDYVAGFTDEGAYREHKTHIGHIEYR